MYVESAVESKSEDIKLGYCLEMINVVGDKLRSKKIIETVLDKDKTVDVNVDGITLGNNDVDEEITSIVVEEGWIIVVDDPNILILDIDNGMIADDGNENICGADEG